MPDWIDPDNDECGDLCRFDPPTGGYVYASVLDWRTFYVLRNLAAWADAWPEAFAHPVWQPSGGSWDDLEWLLGLRWGSVMARWWDAPTPQQQETR